MESLIEAPIFILGAAHSGTTILYKMLALHPDLAWFSQFSQRDYTIPGRFSFPTSRLLNALSRQVVHHDWKKRWRLVDRFVPRPGEAHQIWDYLLPPSQKFYTAEDCDSDTLQRMTAVFGRELRAWGRSRLMCKLPRLSRAVMLLNQAFPDAFFVHIVRDGRAVSFSNRHKFSRANETPAESLEKSASYWLDIVTHLERARSRIGQGRFFTLRYEDFCADTLSTLRSLMKFCGLSANDMDTNCFPESLKVTNDKWLEAAPAEEIQWLAGYLREALDTFGYLD